MALTIYHNPKCSTSRNAIAKVEAAGTEHDVVLYLKDPIADADLAVLIARLEDPVADLVRKDKRFGELGLNPNDYVDDVSVRQLLQEHQELLQRPLIDTGDKVFIARPLDRLDEVL